MFLIIYVKIRKYIVKLKLRTENVIHLIEQKCSVLK